METPPKHLTIDQLHEWYRVRNPDHPYFCYVSENGTKAFISKGSVGKAIHRSIDIIRSEVPEQENGSTRDEPMVLGLLANTDWSTFIAFLYAHIYLTHPKNGRPVLPFLISPRNSAIAVAHLLKEVKCSYIWVTEGPLIELANEALGINTDFKTTLKKFPSFHDIYNVEPLNIPVTYDDSFVDPSTRMAILHSSGSTAYPKVRYFTHEFFYQTGDTFESGGKYPLNGEIIACSPPAFHALGLFMSAMTVRQGMSLAVQSPFAPPGPLSTETFLNIIRITDSSYALTIPSFLEDCSRDPAAIEVLRKLRAIIWGGGPLSNEIGTQLRDEGVALRILYAATEFQGLNRPLQQTLEEGHDWFKFRSDSDIVLLETDKDNIFQVVIKRTKTHALTAFNTEINGVPAYDTNDLVERHSKKHDLYHVVGRADDQIMLSTGEKTNPGPLEAIIKRNPHIKDALIFGRGRQANGILVQPTSFEEAERLGVEGFRNLIWSSVEEANAYAPAHSHILKEMILIASASDPFTYTPKETLRKGNVLATYADKIEALYTDVESSIHAEISVPFGSHPQGGWTEDESRKYVRTVLSTILNVKGKEIGDTDDIFGFGCDSLQATYIRNTLVHALRQVAPLPNIHNLPANFVYQLPTIESLSHLLAQASRSEAYEHTAETPEARQMRLESMIHRYTSNWPTHTPKKEYGKEEVILLTGSTGGLGSQLLAQLIQLSSVSKIYVLNRPGKKLSLERHLDAFKDRGNDVELLKSSKIVFAEGDASYPGFALDVNLFNEMKDSVTTIIHNAWNVNFNISLASFEPAIRGVRNMINLALSSPYKIPPKLLFTSSIGTIKTWTNIPPIEEGPFVNIDLLQPSGYGESKWVSERILTIAKAETALQSVIIRVGQLSGGINGNWNVTDWFPSAITAGQIIGRLPDYVGVASFVPLHHAASAIIELRKAPVSVAHIVHPRPIKWRELIRFVSEELKLPVVPFSDWVDRLEKLPQTEENSRRTQAVHLVPFYKGAIRPENSIPNEEEEIFGLPTFQSEKTVGVVKALSETNLPRIDRTDVLSWITYWRMKRYLK